MRKSDGAFFSAGGFGLYRWWVILFCVVLLRGCLWGETSTVSPHVDRLLNYYQHLCRAKPERVSMRGPWHEVRRTLREKLLRCVGLWPLPDRVPLNIQQSEALDHPWCTVRCIHYQLWPQVTAAGLLFVPKQFRLQPAPAVLCPHGHFEDGHANPVVQTRCLVLAYKGYVVFSPTQNHYEDLNLGVSHQTLGVWNNMRALDYLMQRPDVDGTKIGACGCSGGGLQTQMIAALDDRVKVAVIAGYTCESHEILFPSTRAHCGCNHFPNYLRFIDHPGISTLAFPRPLCFLTMNDWTQRFQERNYPVIKAFYAEHGYPDRTACYYAPTPHNYDRTKRERTYWWLDRWLMGSNNIAIAPEPAEDLVRTFPTAKIQGLVKAEGVQKDFTGISDHFRKKRGFSVPVIADLRAWRAYRSHMVEVLKALLGEPVVLPRTTEQVQVIHKSRHGQIMSIRCLFPGEGSLMIPATVLYKVDGDSTKPVDSRNKQPVCMFCQPKVNDDVHQRALQYVRDGAVVVLPDVRFTGELSQEELARDGIGPWRRNAIVWGRPLIGMASTDIRYVIDGLKTLTSTADIDRVFVITLTSGDLACAALFAAALDQRIVKIDVDLRGSCFQNGKLSTIPFVLKYGDVLQWASISADRRLILRNIPSEAGSQYWLTRIQAFHKTLPR